MITRAQMKGIAKEAISTQRNMMMLNTLWMVLVSIAFSAVSESLFPMDAPIEARMRLGELIFSFIQFAITSVIGIGFASMALRLLDGVTLTNAAVFDRFDKFLDAFALMFVMAVKVFLWTLLLIIPGIIAAYRYRMATYIWLENPSLSATEAINMSSDLMRGHKFELFVLDLSFFLWGLSVVFSLGLMLFWVAPYVQVTEAVFFRELATEAGMYSAVAEVEVDGEELTA